MLGAGCWIVRVRCKGTRQNKAYQLRNRQQDHSPSSLHSPNRAAAPSSSCFSHQLAGTPCEWNRVHHRRLRGVVKSRTAHSSVPIPLPARARWDAVLLGSDCSWTSSAFFSQHVEVVCTYRAEQAEGIQHNVGLTVEQSSSREL